MKAILLAANISSNFRNYLAARYSHFIDVNTLSDIKEEEFASIAGVVTSNKLNLNAKTLSKFSALKWIARLGSGMEIIDLNYCKQHAIHCFGSPSGIANSVAEHAVGMLLNLRHRISSSYEEIKHGQWIREQNRGLEIEDMTLGIIGYGHTGMAFAKKMKPFVSSILAYDKYKHNFNDGYVQEVTLQTLQAKATIISIHLPLTNETTYFYNKAFIDSVAQAHIFINTSRGKIASTLDILYGLKSKKIIGACLDVLEEEPTIQEALLQENSSIQQLMQQQVILTPHIAGYSHNAIEKMSEELRQQIDSILS